MSAPSISEMTKIVDASPLALKETGPITKEGMVFKTFYVEYAYAHLQVERLKRNGAPLSDLSAAMSVTASKAKAVADYIRKGSPNDPSVGFFEAVAVVNSQCTSENLIAMLGAAEKASDNKADK